MSSKLIRTYLGDGLYAEHDGFQFWLISSNGIEDLNRVALEPYVLDAFMKYIERTLGVDIVIKKVQERMI